MRRAEISEIWRTASSRRASSAARCATSDRLLRSRRSARTAAKRSVAGRSPSSATGFENPTATTPPCTWLSSNQDRAAVRRTRDSKCIAASDDVPMDFVWAYEDLAAGELEGVAEEHLDWSTLRLGRMGQGD